MSEPATAPNRLHHHARRMAGRDPHERHRVSTPLELLFDLTFVLSFGFAASQFAHALAAGHYGVAFPGFALASFAIWAWINFTWFASAYDTDDWLFRVTTMVVMAGALIFAIGLPRMFASLEHGDHVSLHVIVLGYVVMRAGMIVHWLRAAKADPDRRAASLTYVAWNVIVQIGWILLALGDLSRVATFALAAPLVFFELAGPWFAERKYGGTPWHPHHIAERYSLFAIIALGEGVVGTVAAVSAVIEKQGWSLDAGLVCFAGIGLTFGMWWTYFILPAAPILHAHRERSFIWGYGLVLVFAAIVATGAGLHVAAYYIEGEAHIGPLATVLTVAVPVSIYLALIYALYSYMVQAFDPLHFWLLLGTVAVVTLSVAAAIAGVGMTTCLVILTFAPAVTVVGYETLGHRHQLDALSANDAEPET